MGNFKKLAIKHQLKQFKGKNQEHFEIREGRAQPHWLTKESAEAGKIFYEGYGIFKAVKRFRNNKANTPEWFYDTLRSQHIPFNFFVPLRHEYALCIKVLNQLLKLEITEILEIKFEFSPPDEHRIGDKTSFDVFIRYSIENHLEGFLGIEVKYTEGGYSAGKKENEFLKRYHKLSPATLYNNPGDTNLEENRYRQVWRNHLLAGVFAEKAGFAQFHSVTLYPEGNAHFANVIKEFPDQFLNENGKKSLHGITYEEFIQALIDHSENNQQLEWIKYLVERYLVNKRNDFQKQFSDLR
jgi:hypothetical protein